LTYYTAMPLEIVFAGFQEEMEPLEELQIQGVHLQVERLDPTSVRIVRVVSANLEDYLNPKWMPGQVIRYHPFH
jgi:hypothetical protein